MEPGVFVLVLLAAALHASWNALIKVGGDALIRLALVNITAALCALPCLLFVAPPQPASWPYLAGSVLIHQAYFLFLVLSYRAGDLALVYPIARGAAPLLVAIGAFAFAGERLSTPGVLAVGLICLAILSLAFERGWRRGISRPALYALCTGLTIAAYTLCDGVGGRLSGDVFGYIAWLFVLEGPPSFLIAALLRWRGLLTTLRQHWRQGLLGGAWAFAAYGLVIWAMSRAPMTYVSALRETSVIMAAWLGARLLREPFGRRRLAAATAVVVGVMLLHLSRAR